MISYRAVIREAFSQTENAARRIGVCPNQYQLMLAIKHLSDVGDVHVQDVARMLKVQHHSAVGLIKRAVSKGIVEKRRCGKLGQYVVLTVTNKGEELINKMEPYKQIEEQILKRSLQ